MMRLSRWAVSSYETDEDLARERDALSPHVEVLGRDEDAEIVVVTSSRPVDAAVLAQAPSAELVITTTSGYDHLDLGAIAAHGAQAARSPLARRDAVVEHALRHLMHGLQQIPQMTLAARDGRWLRPQLPRLAPRSLGDATVGVVGCGVIGRRAIEWLRIFGATVVAHDPAGVPEGVPAWSVERMVAECDAVTLHCHLTPETRGMIDEACLAGARDLVFVNTARGKLVELPALRAALADGRLRYAGLDVFPAEPPPELASLADDPRVGVSPHSAGYSVGLARRVREEVVATTAAFARGEPLPHPIPLP